MPKHNNFIYVDFCDLYVWSDFIVKFTLEDNIDTPSYYINHEDGVLHVKLPTSFKQNGNFQAAACLFLDKNRREIRHSYSKFVDDLSNEELKSVFEHQKLSGPYIFKEASKRLDRGGFISQFLVFLVNLAQNIGGKEEIAKSPFTDILQQQTASLLNDSLSYLKSNTAELAEQLTSSLGVDLANEDMDDDDDDDEVAITFNLDELSRLTSSSSDIDVGGISVGKEAEQLKPKALDDLEKLDDLLKQNANETNCSYQQAQALVPLTDVKLYHGAELVLRKSIKNSLLDCSKDTINKLEFLDLPALRALNAVVASHPKITKEFFNLAVEAIGGVSEFLCGVTERRNLSNFIENYKNSLTNSQNQAELEAHIAVDSNGFFDSSVDLLHKLTVFDNAEDNIYYSLTKNDDQPFTPESPFTLLIYNIFCKTVFKTDVDRYLDIGSDYCVRTNLKYLLDCGSDYFKGLVAQEWGALSKSLTQVDQSIFDLSTDFLKLKSHNTASMAKMICQVVCGDKDAFAATSEKSLSDQLSEARKIVNSFNSLHFFANVKFRETDTTVLDYYQMSTTIQKLFAAIFNLLFNPNDEPVKETNNVPKPAFIWQNIAPTQDEAKLVQERFLANNPDSAWFLDSHLTSLLQQEIDLKLMLRALSVFTYIYNPLFQTRLMFVSNVIDVEAIVLYMQFTFNLIYTSLLRLLTNCRLAAALLPYTVENKSRFPHLERILQYGELALGLLNTLVRKPVLHKFYFMSFPKDSPNQDLVFVEKAYQYSSDVLCWMRNALVLGKTNKAEDEQAQKLWTERFQPLLLKNLSLVTDYWVEVNLTYLLCRKATHDMTGFYHILHGEKSYFNALDSADVLLSQFQPCLSLPLQIIAHVPSELVFADYLAHADSVAKVDTKIDPKLGTLQADGLSFDVVENKSLSSRVEVVFNPSSRKLLVLMQSDWFAKFQAYVKHAQAEDSQLTQEDVDFAKELYLKLNGQLKNRLACLHELQLESTKNAVLTSSEYSNDMSSVTCNGKTFKVFYDTKISVPAVVKISSYSLICLLPRAALGAEVYKEIDTMLAAAINLKDQTVNGGKLFEDFLMYMCTVRWNFWDRNWRGVKILEDGSISFRDLTYEVCDTGSLLAAELRLENGIDGLHPMIYMPKFLQKDLDVLRSLGSLLTYKYEDSLCSVLRSMRDNLRKDFIRISGHVKTFKGNVNKYEQSFGDTEPERVQFLRTIVTKLDEDLDYMKIWSGKLSSHCQELVKRCEHLSRMKQIFPLVQASGRYKIYRYEYDRFYKAFEQALDKLEHLKQTIKAELPKKTRKPRSNKVMDEAED